MFEAMLWALVILVAPVAFLATCVSIRMFMTQAPLRCPECGSTSTCDDDCSYAGR